MKYDPQIHHRRSIRLHGYDYSQAGAYFVTICTDRQDLLLRSARVQEVILTVWRSLPERFPTVALDEFVIMPNHMHGIIVLGTEGGRSKQRPYVGQGCSDVKSLSAIEANKALNRSGQSLWQRNYYEHVIRDHDDLNHIRRYIRDNPLNWQSDPDNPLNT